MKDISFALRPIATAVIVLCLSSSTLFAQGMLPPPPGPPGPTMKSLDQLDTHIAQAGEKRIPISSVPFDISQPGSYYLIKDLSGAAPGITASVSGVTIDLNGFTLKGPGKALVGTGSGIVGLNDTVVRNGRVSDFGDDGVNLGAAVVVENLDVVNMGGKCIVTGEQSRIQHCRVGAGNQGLVVGLASTVDSCISISNTAGTPGAGIVAGASARVINSISSFNAGDGISAGNGASISSCVAANNTASGIVTTIGTAVTECTLRSNGGAGVIAGSGSTIKGCTISDFGTDGVRATTFCIVLENHVTGTPFQSGKPGIHIVGSGNQGGNRIEANQVMACDPGIQVDNSGNLIIKNSVGSGGIAYKIVINNVLTVVSTGKSGAPVNGNSGGQGLGTTDPWANLSY